MYSSHIEKLMKPEVLCKTIKEAKAAIKKYQKDHPDVVITHLAGTGLSGVGFVTALSVATKIPACLVRKKVTSHTDRIVEYSGNLEAYLFVDDLMATGVTFDRVVTSITQENPAARCLGTLLYHHQVRICPED